MTESNITREHEGKHGVLTLGGSRNDVTITVVGSVSYSAQVDVESVVRYFDQSDGWQFTPDPDPLPTEPGWYMCTAALRLDVPVLYFLTTDGNWYRHLGDIIQDLPAERLSERCTADPDPLVRVSFGVAS